MDETTISYVRSTRISTLLVLTLGDQPVEVLVAWSLDAKVAAADIVDGLVVDHEGTVGVLKGSVGGENRVVWLDDRGGDLRSWVDTELQLALLAVVDRQTLHEERTETGTSTTTERVEDQETLETRAVVSNPTDLVQDFVNELLSDGVVTTSVVVGSVLLAGDHLVRVEQRAVGTSADDIDDVWLQIAVDGAWNVFSIACMFRQSSALHILTSLCEKVVPVSEKKVENPWSWSFCLRSSLRYPSGYHRQSVNF